MWLTLLSITVNQFAFAYAHHEKFVIITKNKFIDILGKNCFEKVLIATVFYSFIRFAVEYIFKINSSSSIFMTSILAFFIEFSSPDEENGILKLFNAFSSFNVIYTVLQYSFFWAYGWSVYCSLGMHLLCYFFANRNKSTIRVSYNRISDEEEK